MSEENLNENQTQIEPEQKSNTELEVLTLTGKVIFKLANEGSKSESSQPYLLTSEGQEIHLFLKDSNPFENNQLKQYEDKNITAEGIMKENTFVISDIKTDIQEE